MSTNVFWLPVVCVISALAIGLAYTFSAGLPFFSESHTHLLRASTQDSWTQCLDLELVPLRPFQHLYFFWLAHFDVPPALARVPAFLLHAGSCALVGLLVKRLGGGATGAGVAVMLFALAPTAKNLVWVASISGPGRVFFLLAGLNCFARGQETRGRLPLACTVACFVAALGFHQSAVVFPGLAALAAFFLIPTPAQASPRLRQVFDARILLPGAIAGLYLAYLFFRPERHHRVAGFEFLPASTVKALLALLPELVRRPAIEGLRGELGPLGTAVGAAVCLLVVGLALALLWKGRRVGRFAVLAIGLDTVLPVLAGYTQRYAYLASAFVAIGLGLAFAGAKTERARRALATVIGILGALWAVDQARDVLDYRAAGSTARHLLAQAAEVREQVGPEGLIAIVDLPDMAGRERDLPLFNWGFPQAAAAAGIAGPWNLLRTRAYATTTDVRLIGPAEFARVVADASAPVLVYLPNSGSFEIRRQ